MSFPCQIFKPPPRLSPRYDYHLYWELYDEDNADQELIMPQTFVTFGQRHTHRINGQTLDCDTVAVIEAPNAQAGREAAFQLFGPKFSMEYHDKEWNETNIKMFPKGYMYL